MAVDSLLRSLSLAPELLWAAREDRLSDNETGTAGYTVFHLNASYSLARSHHAHVFSLNGLNLTNERYLSAAHVPYQGPGTRDGRSVRVSYAIRCFGGLSRRPPRSVGDEATFRTAADDVPHQATPHRV